MSETDKIWIVIPAYKPNYNLIDLIYSLISITRLKILIVDDGSSLIYSEVFQLIAKFKEAKVIKNKTNLGKGFALKKAFKYLLGTHNKINGVITIDADGQHDPIDTYKIILKSKKFPNELIIGTRNFSKKNIPLRSSFGNTLTKEVFFLITKKMLSDTQSGLRYIPKKFMIGSLDIPYNRYNFEQEFLLRAVSSKSVFHQVPIKTIYIKGNMSSHFRPIIDSLKIYYVFIRHSITSIITSTIDYAAFIFCHLITDNIFISIITGRLSSIFFSFYISRKYVYKFPSLNYKIFFKYVLIVSLMTTLTYQGIKLLNSRFDLNIIASKIIIESIFFVVNFINLRFFVFKK